jgi:hypothetical protein
MNKSQEAGENGVLLRNLKKAGQEANETLS